MSLWQSNYQNQQTLPRIQEIVRLLESVKTDGLAPGDLENYGRLLKVSKILSALFTNLDPDLYHQNTWANFGSWLENAKTQINSFIQNKNAALLQSANGLLDEILNAMRPLHQGMRQEEVKAIIEAGVTFQSKALSEIDNIHKGAESIRNELTSLTSLIQQEKTKIEESNRIIEQQKGRLDQSIAQFQTQFSQEQSTRSNRNAEEIKKYITEFANQKIEFEGKFKTSETARQTEHETLLAEIRKKSNEHYKFLEGREEAVNKIFGAIGASSMAGSFKTTADEERSTANVWRGISIAFMALMVLIAGYTYYLNLRHPEVDWKLFSFRLLTSFVVLIPAVYAAQESAKHRDRERHIRKAHLELASIDAYLSLMPEAQRNDLKAKLTEKFFGREEIEKVEEPVTKHALFELVSSVVKNITKGH